MYICTAESIYRVSSCTHREFYSLCCVCVYNSSTTAAVCTRSRIEVEKSKSRSSRVVAHRESSSGSTCSSSRDCVCSSCSSYTQSIKYIPSCTTRMYRVRLLSLWEVTCVALPHGTHSPHTHDTPDPPPNTETPPTAG